MVPCFVRGAAVVIELVVHEVENEPLPGSSEGPQLAEKKKDQGNRHFALGRWAQASRRYKEGAAYLEALPGGVGLQ